MCSASRITQTRRLGGERLEGELGDQPGDLLEADELALALDHVRSGCTPRAQALALVAVPAAAAGGHEGGAQLEREARLPRPSGPASR